MKRFPNTYVIIFGIIVLCALATWLVPGGEYVKDINTGEFVFQSTQSNGQWWQVFSTFYNGFVQQSGIIVFILIIGGAFWIINKSRSIDAGIYRFLERMRRLERNPALKRIGVDNIVIVAVMLVFSLFGAVFGMSEETIAFVALVIPLAISMGYDSVVGVCMVYVAAHVGFAGAILNPFTIGIAQNIAGIPMFSGIEYRFFCWFVLTAITIVFVLWYAARVKKNPQKSFMYEHDSFWRKRIEEDAKNGIEYYKNRASIIVFALSSAIILIFTAAYCSSTVIKLGTSEYSTPWLLPVTAVLYLASGLFALRKSVHYFILNVLGFTIIYLLIGVLAFGWYIPEISALFLAMGIICGIAMGLSANDIVKEFLNGAKDIMSAALVVGLAAGIVFILREGKIIDTILYSMANSLENAGGTGSLGLMYIIQAVVNIVIPSASAKAAITMPIMAPFADLIGVSRQATVLAFQFGDGFTNMITPTSGVLIAVLGIARIPYNKWLKWILPFVGILIIIGFLLLIPTVCFSLPGF